MALVTLAQVNAALRLDLQGDAPAFEDDPRTPDVTLKIDQAEDIVLDFIQPAPDPAYDAETVPPRVTAAIIMAVGYLIDDSEEAHEALAALSGHDLNHRSPLVGLLKRLRDPSLA